VGDGNLGLSISLKTENHFTYTFRMGLTPPFIWDIFDKNMEISSEKYDSSLTDSNTGASSTFGISSQVAYYFLRNQWQPYIYLGFSAGQMYFGPYDLNDRPIYIEGFLTTFNFGIGTEYNFLKRAALFAEVGANYPFGMGTDIYYKQDKSVFSPLFPCLRVGISVH
jgi:hypothetical protein